MAMDECLANSSLWADSKVKFTALILEATVCWPT